MSQILKNRLTKTMSKHRKFCKLRVIFQTSNRLKNCFRFKDFVPETLRASFIYKFSCGSCTLVRPIDMSKQEFQNIRIFSQEQVNQLKVPYLPLMTCSVCDHKVVHEDFKFLGNESNRIYWN